MANWLNPLNQDPIPWLLYSKPWTKYKTLTDLLDYPDSHKETIRAKSDLLNDKNILQVVREAKDWMPVAPTRNNDPKISYFKLRMLGDFGLKHDDLDLSIAVKKATENICDNMFAVRGQTPDQSSHNEKTDPTADAWHVPPCNSPVITCALVELGVINDKVIKAVEGLTTRWNDSKGWFCHFFFVESQFKKLQIGCPMAGLVTLDVFSKIHDLKDSIHSQFAFEPIRYHKDSGRSLYYFGRSRKFWTMKYPFVWYNALYMADVLTRFELLKKELLVGELVEWIIHAQSGDGRFFPTSMFQHYKGWDFANKREPSPWITFLCCRILRQYFG
jgi:hypothetical protein